jgi:flagellar M-ring protein FliF
MGLRRLILMGGVAALILGALAWVAMPSSSTAMGYLYTELDPSAAKDIAEKLQATNVPFQVSSDGTAIMAPQDKIAELRMSMAADRLGGKIGYEVLDQEEPFGVSASRAKLNETRAIEGELSKSIQSLENVSQARVHIVMPERAIFSSEQRRATAGVTVKTRGRLSPEAVQSIRYLVASSVPELAPESVSIVDQTGALLARAGEAGAVSGSDVDERQQAIETHIREQIESMLEPIVGQGKVRAEVSALVDRDQTREESSIVDPDRQAVAHQVTVESKDQSDENDGGAAPATVSNQLPENQAPAIGGANDSRRSAKNETSEDTTYENSRTSTVTVREPGKIKRLTVAVMLDPGSQPMPAPQLQRLQRLVENAVGFDAERGDSVAVESMRFSAADLAESESSWLPDVSSDQVFSLIKILIIAAVALIALRMMVSGTGGFASTLQGAVPMLTGSEGEQPLLAGSPGSPQLALEQAEQRAAMLDQEISLAEVDGRVKLSVIKRIGETVASSPGEATSVVRQWMSS